MSMVTEVIQFELTIAGESVWERNKRYLQEWERSTVNRNRIYNHVMGLEGKDRAEVVKVTWEFVCKNLLAVCTFLGHISVLESHEKLNYVHPQLRNNWDAVRFEVLKLKMEGYEI